MANGSAMTKPKLLLADDHTLVRAGLRALVESIDGAEVVGESGEGREAPADPHELRDRLALLHVQLSRMLRSAQEAAPVAFEPS